MLKNGCDKTQNWYQLTAVTGIGARQDTLPRLKIDLVEEESQLRLAAFELTVTGNRSVVICFGKGENVN